MNISFSKNCFIINSIKSSSNFPFRRSSKFQVQLSKHVLDKLETDEMKPRHHPGINRTGKIAIPSNIQKGIIRSIGDYPLKSLIKDGEALSRYLNARHAPAEDLEIKKKLIEIENEIDVQHPRPTSMQNEELINYRNSRQQKIKKIINQRIMKWKTMNYGQYEALVYAIGRSAQEYSILVKILKEIATRDANFKPRSYFDFGSGVGSGMWAASSLWKETIFEYLNIDSSREMNNLSDLILHEGNPNQENILKNVYYRQFFPANNTKYDLIVSSFSLFELPNLESRQETLLSLWNKCTGYLVLVEEGTKRAFNLITEAREYLLNNKDNHENPGYVFSPCPHDLRCPRQEIKEDKTPCNFEANFQPLQIIKETAAGSKHLYSFVVLKKGLRDQENVENWPRIVRPTLLRSKHAICRMCKSNGKLQEIIFTVSKHGKPAYKCAKSSKWGDRLPIEIVENN